MNESLRRLWIAATCNWFVIGLQCATRGHRWREEGVWTVERHWPERRSEFLITSGCRNCGLSGGWHYHDRPGITDCAHCKRNGSTLYRVQASVDPS